LDDGQLLTEGPAIVQYLADLKPESGLAPPSSSFARYRLQEWLNFITSELHKSFSGLFSKQAPPEWKAQIKESLHARFDYVAEQLGSQSYLLGETFTVADAYLFTIVRWTAYVHIDLSPWPTLVAYQARVGARPAVQAALAAEAK
jgi:glutathione S-transferase